MLQSTFTYTPRRIKRINYTIPRELIGETGVRKKRTEVTITTTRFTQLPTEWVTGDTRCKIMYETCTNNSRQHLNNIYIYSSPGHSNSNIKLARALPSASFKFFTSLKLSKSTSIFSCGNDRLLIRIYKLIVENARLTITTIIMLLVSVSKEMP